MKNYTYGIIPARYASKRFPGKPLTLINGKPLIQRTYEQASSCKLFDKLFVATDDLRIKDLVESFGGNVLMTSLDCINGTHRILDAIKKFPILSLAKFIVNIQCDHPCISHNSIQKVLLSLQKNPLASISTAVFPFKGKEQAKEPNIVKCVFDNNNCALYFSRSPIPYFLSHDKNSVYYQHIGLYAFRLDFLLDLIKTPLSPQNVFNEDLEQLEWLKMGYKIAVTKVNEKDLGVDCPQDVKKIEEYLNKNINHLLKK
jgi:3-deoxy-manno-octulosonate cytidylyltransferase (CMP-KDO synthetase)